MGIADRQGRFTKWNKAAEDIYGYTKRDMIGKHFSCVYPDERELEIMLSQFRRDGFIRKYQINLKKKDGSIAPSVISISKLHGRNRENVGSICIVRDR
jgi:PAS domain S-box-containing protein